MWRKRFKNTASEVGRMLVASFCFSLFFLIAQVTAEDNSQEDVLYKDVDSDDMGLDPLLDLQDELKNSKSKIEDIEKAKKVIETSEQQEKDRIKRLEDSINKKIEHIKLKNKKKSKTDKTKASSKSQKAPNPSKKVQKSKSSLRHEEVDFDQEDAPLEEEEEAQETENLVEQEGEQIVGHAHTEVPQPPSTPAKSKNITSHAAVLELKPASISKISGQVIDKREEILFKKQQILEKMNTHYKTWQSHGSLTALNAYNNLESQHQKLDAEYRRHVGLPQENTEKTHEGVAQGAIVKPSASSTSMKEQISEAIQASLAPLPEEDGGAEIVSLRTGV